VCVCVVCVCVRVCVSVGHEEQLWDYCSESR
jgi:hypothetical protein